MRTLLAVTFLLSASLVPFAAPAPPSTPAAATYPGLVADIDFALDGSVTILGEIFGTPLAANGTYAVGQPATLDLPGGLGHFELTSLGLRPGNQQVDFHYVVDVPLLGILHVGDYYAPLGSWRIAYTPVPYEVGGANSLPEDPSLQDSVFVTSTIPNRVSYGYQVQFGTACDQALFRDYMNPVKPTSSFTTTCYGDFAASVLEWSGLPTLSVSSVGGPYPFDAVSPMPFGTMYIRYNE